jgi:predicted ester cyclase
MPKETTTERHRALLIEFYRIWSTGDLSHVDDLLTPDFVDHTSRVLRSADGGTRPARVVQGRQAFMDYVRWERHGLPDLHEEVIAILVDQEWGSGLYRLTGTNLGGFEGSPPTGHPLDFVGMDWFRFVDGQISEWWWSEHDLTGEGTS